MEYILFGVSLITALYLNYKLKAHVDKELLSIRHRIDFEASSITKIRNKQFDDTNTLSTASEMNAKRIDKLESKNASLQTQFAEVKDAGLGLVVELNNVAKALEKKMKKSSPKKKTKK